MKCKRSTEHLLHFCERSLSSRSYAIETASALGGWAWALIQWTGRRAGRSSFDGLCMSFSKTHSRVPMRRDAGTSAGPLRGSSKFQVPSANEQPGKDRRSRRAGTQDSRPEAAARKCQVQKKGKRPCLERAGRGSSAGIIGVEESTG